MKENAFKLVLKEPFCILIKNVKIATLALSAIKLMIVKNVLQDIIYMALNVIQAVRMDIMSMTKNAIRIVI